MFDERHVDLRGENAGGAEAGVHGAQMDERFDQQSGADHQHQRDGQFGGHQRVAQTAAAAHHRAAGDSGARELDGGRESEKQPAEQGNSGAEGSHAPIEAEVRGEAGGDHPLERGDAPACQHQSEQASGGRQQQVLGEHLAQQAHRLCAQRRAHGDFGAAAGGAHQQQRTHIGAGDQQHAAGRADQDEEGDAGVAEEFVFERHHGDAHALVGAGKFGGKLAGDGGHLGLCIGGRPSGLDTTDHFQKVTVAAREQLRRHADGNPEFGLAIGELEARRHHAIDGIGRPAHQDGAANEVRVAAEPPLPEAVTEHHHLAIGVFLFGLEGAAEQWLRAEQRKKIGGDRLARDFLGRSAAGQVFGVAPGVGGHAGEDLRAAAPIEESGGRHAIAGHSEGGKILPEHGQTARIGVRKRADHDLIDGAENG